MNLANQLLHQIADPTITANERAQLRCQLAKELEEIGNYEGARTAMGELWQRIGERPLLSDLDAATAAEVLLLGFAGWWLDSCSNSMVTGRFVRYILSATGGWDNDNADTSTLGQGTLDGGVAVATLAN